MVSSLKGKSFVSEMWMVLKIGDRMAKCRCQRKSDSGSLLEPFPKHFHLIMDWIYFSFTLQSCFPVCCSEIGKLTLVGKLASKHHATSLNWSFSVDILEGWMPLFLFIIAKVTYVHDNCTWLLLCLPTNRDYRLPHVSHSPLR